MAALNAARMRKKSAIQPPKWTWDSPENGESKIENKFQLEEKTPIIQIFAWSNTES